MIARQAMLVFALCVAPAQVAGAACACSSRPECTSAGVDLTAVPLNGMHLDLCGCKVQPGFADAVPFCYVADAQACEQCELPQGCPDRVTQSSVVSGLAWRQCSLSPVLPPPALRGAAAESATARQYSSRRLQQRYKGFPPPPPLSPPTPPSPCRRLRISSLTATSGRWSA